MSQMWLLLWASVAVSVAAANNAGRKRATAKAHGDEGVTPVQQVLKMMAEMKQKAIDAKKAEEVQFSTFSQWCEDEIGSTKAEVKAGKAKMNELKVFISSKDRELAKLARQIMKIKEDLTAIEQSKEDITSIRGKDSTEYNEAYKDTTESIAAIDGALKVLQEQNYDRAQVSLVQVRDLKTLPLEARDSINDFLQQPYARAQADVPESMNPKAHGYEFQSTSVVDMLADLQKKFKTRLNDLNREESKSRHAFDLGMQSLVAREKENNRQLSRLTMIQTETEQEKARAEGDLSSTTTAYNEDSKALADTTAMCSEKKRDFTSRQMLRKHEIEVLTETIDIISGKDVSGAAAKHLPALVQMHAKHRHTALVQLQASEVNPQLERAMAFLEAQAQAQNSPLLIEVAEKAKTNPFQKVLKLLRELMYKLSEEATAETESKGYCDAELTTNEQTRNSKTESLNKLDLTIEDLTATIATLTEDAAELTAQIAELKKAQAEATEIRTAAAKKAEETILDAKGAQIAVQNALSVIKTFYAKAASAKAFAQMQSGSQQPEIFDEPFKGNQVEGGSVVDFLEVILSDFMRLEQDTATQEAMEVQAYRKYMADTDVDLATKSTELKYKASGKTDAEKDLLDAKTERATTQEQLDAALAYYDKLKPKCVDTGVTYAERKQRRENEIQALEGVLKIMQGSDIA